MKPSVVIYLRVGRHKRSSGTVCGTNMAGLVVKPHNPAWKRITVTKEEISAGSEKPPIRPRVKREGEPAKRKPKPKPVPRWREVVAILRRWHPSDRELDLLMDEAADLIEVGHAEFLPINMKP